MLYVRDIEDQNGDLVDVEYFCSSVCAPPDAGAWPGGMETDYAKWCHECGDLIDCGLVCENCQRYTMDGEVCEVCGWEPVQNVRRAGSEGQ